MNAEVTIKQDVIPIIIEQHAEEAAFLWRLREAAAVAPDYNLEELAELDERVEAHIDGLIVAGEFGWQICLELVESGDFENLFVLTLVALRVRDANLLRKAFDVVLEQSEAQPEMADAFVSAFSWLPSSEIAQPLAYLMQSEECLFRHLALEILSRHRVQFQTLVPLLALDDFDKQLFTWLSGDETLFYITACRLAGELGFADLRPAVSAHMDSADVGLRTQAALTAALLGDRDKALKILQNLLLTQSELDLRILETLIPLLAPEAFQELFNTLTRPEGSEVPLSVLTHTVLAVGMTGQVDYIDWLIAQMANPDLARRAGEALCLITGVDLELEALEGELPEGHELGPNDDPLDEDVEVDAEDGLLWPDQEQVRQWWQSKRQHYVPHQRYLMGQPWSEACFQRALREGRQSQRRFAARMIALQRPDNRLFEVRALCVQQRQALAIG